MPRGPIYGPGPGGRDVPRARSPSSNATSGFPRCAMRSARPCCSPGPRPQADVDASHVVVSVDGHVAIDLRLAGEIVPKRTVADRLNPIPAARRLRGAWRVGRLRSALPRWPSGCSTGSTPISKPSRARRPHQPAAHRAAAPQPGHPAGSPCARDPHGHAHRYRPQPHDRRFGGPARAGRGPPGRPERRGDPRSQPERPRADAPRVAPAPELPEEAAAVYIGRRRAPARSDNGIIREALRLRVRWIQELSGRAAWELGERLAAVGSSRNRS